MLGSASCRLMQAAIPLMEKKHEEQDRTVPGARGHVGRRFRRVTHCRRTSSTTHVCTGRCRLSEITNSTVYGDEGLV
jgi:hypothetical protein